METTELAGCCGLAIETAKQLGHKLGMEGVKDIEFGALMVNCTLEHYTHWFIIYHKSGVGWVAEGPALVARCELNED